MRKTHTLLLLALFVCALPVAARADLSKFTPESGEFSILLPGTPQPKTITAANIKTTLYMTQTEEGAAGVSAADVSAVVQGENEDQIQNRLDGGVNGMVANVKGKLISVKKIRLEEKHPGREVRVSLPVPNAFVRARMYMADGKLITIQVIGLADYVDSAEAQKVLESFELKK